jgi:hypothetical protein
MNTSQFGTINWKDFAHALFFTALTAVAASVGQALESWIACNFCADLSPFTKISLVLSLKAGAGAGLSFLLAKFGFNSKGQILKKEQKGNDTENS